MQSTSEIWEAIQRITSLENPPNVLLFGPPGTGKTHLATRFQDGSRVRYSVTLTDETPAAELRGHFIPSENGFRFHYGPAVLARKEGTRFVVNEIDRTGPDAWSYLLNVCDGIESSIETLPNGETFSTAPGFHVIATMNGEPDDLPEALADRFPVRFHVTEVNPEAIAALPDDLRNAASGTGAIPDNDRRLSVRKWSAFASLRDSVGADLAAFAIFGSQSRSILDSLTVANGGMEPGRLAIDRLDSEAHRDEDEDEDDEYCARCDRNTGTWIDENGRKRCADCEPEDEE